MSIKPISPDEAISGKQIPDEVFSVVNQLLSEKFNGTSVTIKQDEIVKKLVNRGFDRQQIFDRHWLDFEAAYQSAGWKVEYDKPGCGEDYDAYFRFSRRKS